MPCLWPFTQSPSYQSSALYNSHPVPGHQRPTLYHFRSKLLTISLGQAPLAFVQTRRRFHVQRPISMEEPLGKLTLVLAQVRQGNFSLTFRVSVSKLALLPLDLLVHQHAFLPGRWSHRANGRFLCPP